MDMEVVSDLRMNESAPVYTRELVMQMLAQQLEWDWEKFRRNVAKDILASIVNKQLSTFDIPAQVKSAIRYADELVRQLKESESKE